MSKKLSANIVLGFDFGIKHIGVAVGQLITQSANPVTILSAQDGIPDWEEISKLINEWQVDTLIVGIPFNMDGTEMPITFAARKFANRLQNHFKLPVHLVDERLTTKEAKRQLHEHGTKAIDLKHVDSYAAKLILESWLQK